MAKRVHLYRILSTPAGASFEAGPNLVPPGRTRLAMESAAPSPFLGVPEAEWVCANALCFAIFESYPVSPGHVRVITRPVVPTFFECTAAEQGALMALVGEVKALLGKTGDGSDFRVARGDIALAANGVGGALQKSLPSPVFSPAA